MHCGWTSSKGMRFFASPQQPDQLWGPKSPLFIGYWSDEQGSHSPLLIIQSLKSLCK